LQLTFLIIYRSSLHEYVLAVDVISWESI
jgi:hypothetical protein